jgi:SAM-dependent MidA family methyltransferase
VGSAADAIRVEMAAAGGTLRFDRFQEIALYGPGGFYADVGQAGRRSGDFITAPEVGPLFGMVLARFVEAVWHDLGEPGEFTVVDAGAGPGTLARTIAAAQPAWLDRCRYVAVERSDRQREFHPDWVESVKTRPDETLVGVVIANELLDNLPMRLAVFDGTWREAYVADAGERFVEVLMPLHPVPPWLPRRPALGARAPMQQAATSWVRGVLDDLDRGKLVVIDYASASTALTAQRAWRSWLRTYRRHERGGHYLAEPGSQDITCEIMVDQLTASAREPDAVRTQSQWLQLWGIDDMVAEGRRVWTERSSIGDLAAITARSRVREADALLEPDGLGAHLVLEWTC